MKGERVRELFRKWSVKTGAMVLATALVIGGSVWVDQRNSTPIPELVSFVDADDTISVVEEEVPLATPQVTVSTKTTRKTKKIKMKKAAKKTYSKSTNKKKTTTKKSSSSSAITTTKTVTATNVVNKYKKGSKINTQVTTVKTTITKTVVNKETSSASAASSTETSTSTNTNTSTGTAQNTSSGTSAGVTTASIEAAAPLADSRVISAYKALGFKIEVNPSVSYAGYFDARTQSITMKELNDTIYHELGHFLAFVAGNVDRSASFQQVYAAEKSKYTASNKAYVLSTASEYFAESFKNYTLNPSELKANRPQTYAAIEAAVNTITSDHVTRVANAYKAVWG